jgi:ABC-type molybdate transport system substrate-binding protein
VLTRLHLSKALRDARTASTPAKIIKAVSSWTANAGFVYDSDVSSADARRLRILPIPARARPGVTFDIAIAKHTTDASAAAEFIAEVGSKSSQEILRKSGFGKP